MRQGKVSNYAQRQLLFFSRKNEFPQAGFEPMMSCVLGDTLQLSHRGSSAGQAESLKFMQGKGRLSPDGQGNQS